MVHEKAPSTKEDVIIAIRESSNYFDKEYCIELVKFMPETIKATIKSRGGAIKHKL